MHKVLGLKLYHSSFQVGTVSSRKIRVRNVWWAFCVWSGIYGFEKFFESYKVISLKVVSRKRLEVFTQPLFIARVPAHQVLDSNTSIS